jgi:hypothetical protein
MPRESGRPSYSWLSNIDHNHIEWSYHKNNLLTLLRHLLPFLQLHHLSVVDRAERFLTSVTKLIAPTTSHSSIKTVFNPKNEVAI